MPNLHPQIQRALEIMATLNLKPFEDSSPAEARALMETMAASRKAETLPVAKVESRTIPGPAGQIPVRIYWPNAAGVRPAIVYYHGGGHVIGSLDSHDLVARNLCGGAEAVVVSIDYRMGPEHRFPAAVDDSMAALDWVHANAASIGADPERLGVHGDSAGANLAAVVALIACDRGGPKLRLQSLVYPVADFRMGSESYKKYATGCGILTAGAMQMVPRPLFAHDGRRRGLARFAAAGAECRRGGAGDRHRRRMRRAARRGARIRRAAEGGWRAGRAP
jgi:acetyl esterase